MSFSTWENSKICPSSDTIRVDWIGNPTTVFWRSWYGFTTGDLYFLESLTTITRIVYMSSSFWLLDHMIKVQRADLMCDVNKKLAPFVLSKLWILVADWSMHVTRQVSYKITTLSQAEKIFFDKCKLSIFSKWHLFLLEMNRRCRFEWK